MFRKFQFQNLVINPQFIDGKTLLPESEDFISDPTESDPD